MKKFFLKTIAVFFPCIIIFFDDNPGGALLALILQATIIGWIPAAMWALRIVNPDKNNNKQNKRDI